jgi:hypothetical protein
VFGLDVVALGALALVVIRVGGQGTRRDELSGAGAEEAAAEEPVVSEAGC